MLFETERLIIRPYTVDDLPSLIETRSDPDVYKYLGGWARQNPAEVTKRKSFYIECQEKFGFSMCGMTLKENGEHVGSSGLQPLENTGEIEVGYSLKKEYWRLGLGFEAAYAWLRFGFEKAGLERIVAVCVPENTGSWRIMEKCGMTYEGMRTAYGSEVKWYSITREEFAKYSQAL